MATRKAARTIIADSSFTYIGTFCAVQGGAAVFLMAMYGLNPIMFIAAVLLAIMAVVSVGGVAGDIRAERRAEERAAGWAAYYAARRAESNVAR